MQVPLRDLTDPNDGSATMSPVLDVRFPADELLSCVILY